MAEHRGIETEELAGNSVRQAGSPLAGLVALVAGAGSGIGAATAKVLAADGATVVVSDVDSAGAGAVAAEVRAAGGRASARCLDVADPADIDRAVRECAEEHGGLDILVNAAALVRPGELVDCSLEDWRKVFAVNVEGALQLARACFPLLRASTRPAVVHVASLGGVYGRPNAGAYGASKAALINLSRQMGLEWASAGVRVNVVNPGTIDTPLSRRSLTADTAREREAIVPLGRLGTAAEVAEVIAFLASPRASYVTAQALNVDGGHSQSLLCDPMTGPH